MPGLHFDVLPMPALRQPGDDGRGSAVCASRGADTSQKAADFLVHAISDESFESVAAAGYIVPANLSVARSDAFLQPAQQPAHAGVFNASVDDMRALPLLGAYDELERRGGTAPCVGC